MDPRFVTKTMHAYLDYPVAFVLMAGPFVLGLGGSHPLALWLSVVTGVAALLLTVLTDHHLGIFRVLPYPLHVAVDGMVGVAFLSIPLALGFSGIDLAYYLANGLAVMMVVSLSKPSPKECAQPMAV
jgi:uncharacterized membrane protein YjjP (DUF1212 family)